MVLYAFAASKNPTNQCGPGSHWVSAHHRRGYIKGDGTIVRETDVIAHCQKNPSDYGKWEPRLKNGIPKFGGSNIDKRAEWTAEERERLLEALGEIPDFLKEDFDRIYRMKNLDHSENPASVLGTTLVLYDAAFRSDQNLAQIITHEMAHRYLEKHEGEKESFRKAAKWIGSSKFQPGRPEDQFLRPNGMLSYHEDFADDMAAYIFRPESLKAKSPEIFQWMEKHIGPRLKRGGRK